MTQVTEFFSRLGFNGCIPAEPLPTAHACATHLQENDMIKNVGNIDRALRFTVGAALIVATLTNTIGLWGWIGLLPLATAAIGWCPPYAILGFNTCSMKK